MLALHRAPRPRTSAAYAHRALPGRELHVRHVLVCPHWEPGSTTASSNPCIVESSTIIGDPFSDLELVERVDLHAGAAPAAVEAGEQVADRVLPPDRVVGLLNHGEAGAGE